MMSKLSEHLKERHLSDMKKPLIDKRFANNCFISGPLHSKKFQVSHSDYMNAMVLSNDESFIVVGGRYQGNENVVTWKSSDAFGIQSELKSTVVHFGCSDLCQMKAIWCVAISPDNGRIFSGGFSKRVLIHDVQRAQLMHSIPRDGFVWGISVQPDSLKGDVFASVTRHLGLSIFDIRRSTTDPVIKMDEKGDLLSVMFSPVDTSHVAVAGRGGSKIIDIRQPNQDLLLLSAVYYCQGIRYNSEGNRLIFVEEDAGTQVVELAAFQSGKEKKTLTTPDQMDRDRSFFTCCFAGANDELVIASSENRYSNVWSVPNGRLNTIALDHLVRLPSGPGRFVSAIGYSKQRSALLFSSARNGEIAVWTSYKLPQPPSIEG